MSTKEYPIVDNAESFEAALARVREAHVRSPSRSGTGGAWAVRRSSSGGASPGNRSPGLRCARPACS